MHFKAKKYCNEVQFFKVLCNLSPLKTDKMQTQQTHSTIHEYFVTPGMLLHILNKTAKILPEASR